MPNGKPGDHPITDIVAHGATVFTPEIDGLIRDLDKFDYWNEIASLYVLSLHSRLTRARDGNDASELAQAETELHSFRVVMAFELQQIQRTPPPNEEV